MLPHFIYRMLRRGGYGRHFMQRFCAYGSGVRAKLASMDGPVWVQAVSVGELFVAFKLMESLREARPELRFVLSVNTSTSHAIACKRIDDRDLLIYFPLDFPWVIRRVLQLVKPRMLVLIENEMWPNLIRRAKKEDVPVCLVNGRISENSYRGYRKLRWFFSHLLPDISSFNMQSEDDAERLLRLGAPKDQLKVVGSAKYEVVQRNFAGEAKAAALLKKLGFPQGGPVIMGASTWPGEETILIEQFVKLREKYPDLRLLIVPRHFERADDILPDLEHLSYIRRSQYADDASAPEKAPDCLLLDSTGEMVFFYPVATAIFVGKSLCEHGGQNIVEPGYFGKPVLVGPNMENFPAIIEDFKNAEAILQVANAEELGNELEKVFEDAAYAAAYGRRAAELVQAKSGAVSATVERLLPLIDRVG